MLIHAEKYLCSFGFSSNVSGAMIFKDVSVVCVIEAFILALDSFLILSLFVCVDVIGDMMMMMIVVVIFFFEKLHGMNVFLIGNNHRNDVGHVKDMVDMIFVS